MAATDEGMQALIVSQETIKGGKDINADRKSQGLEKLALIIINLVGLGSKALDGEKLSSTALRKQEAEAKSHRIAWICLERRNQKRLMDQSHRIWILPLMA